VAASLGRLKGVPMKLGQLLGYLDVGVPDRLRSALAALHTSAPPLPGHAVAAVLVAELGDAGRALAETLSPQPLAVGSFGQVHRARLPDGTPVAVKVAYPGVAATIARDFGPATVGSRVATWVAPRTRLDRFVADVRTRLVEECDYALEARRQERFAALFAGHPRIVVPAVERKYSTARVLTSQFVDGLHLDAWLAGGRDAAARDRAGEALFDFYVGALFEHGLYDCDPHPGNYLFLADGRVAFVDFGCVREFEDPGFVARLLALTDAVTLDDRDAIFHALVALGVAQPSEAYYHEATRWLLRAGYGPLVRDEVAAFAVPSGVRLRELLRRGWGVRGLALSAELLFLARTALGLSAVLARLGTRANWYRRVRLAAERGRSAAGGWEQAGAARATSAASSKRASMSASGSLGSPGSPGSSASGSFGSAGSSASPESSTSPAAGVTADTGRYDLVLLDAGASPIALVRELREVTGMELREVKYLIDASPSTIQSALPRAQAESLRARLESAGARVAIRPAAAG
jgi:ribosomal protein L7/L12